MPSRDATTEDVERDSLGALQQYPPRPGGNGMESASWRYAHLLRPADPLWGPISDEEAAKFGAPAGCASVLLQPWIPTCLLAAVESLIPADVKPHPADDCESLRKRLSESLFLDDIHYPKDGNGRGGRRVRLNETSYPQPRRVIYSVMSEEFSSMSPAVFLLFAYTQFGRKPEDWRCRTMPHILYLFGRHLWWCARPHLGEYSRMSPPTALQLMGCVCPKSHAHPHNTCTCTHPKNTRRLHTVPRTPPQTTRCL